jgi:hypothetical protein
MQTGVTVVAVIAASGTWLAGLHGCVYRINPGRPIIDVCGGIGGRAAC